MSWKVEKRSLVIRHRTRKNFPIPDGTVAYADVLTFETARFVPTGSGLRQSGESTTKLHDRLASVRT